MMPPNGILGAIICLVAVFLPAYLLILGALPFWRKIRAYSAMRSALLGANAAVVGLLGAAFYSPVWTSSIFGLSDFLLATFYFTLLVRGYLPVYIIVILGAAVSGVTSL